VDALVETSTQTVLQRRSLVKAINLITLLLIIVGGINWLLVSLADFDLVATIFGGSDSALATVVYVLVGVSALYQLVPFFRALSDGEVAAESSTRHV
jgi:uncharacterized membrane protein YuzA (DUF378 family)